MANIKTLQELSQSSVSRTTEKLQFESIESSPKIVTIFPSIENTLLIPSLRPRANSTNQAQRPTIFPLTENMLLQPSFKTTGEFDGSSPKAKVIFPWWEHAFQHLIKTTSGFVRSSPRATTIFPSTKNMLLYPSLKAISRLDKSSPKALTISTLINNALCQLSFETWQLTTNPRPRTSCEPLVQDNIQTYLIKLTSFPHGSTSIKNTVSNSLIKIEIVKDNQMLFLVFFTIYFFNNCSPLN